MSTDYNYDEQVRLIVVSYGHSIKLLLGPVLPVFHPYGDRLGYASSNLLSVETQQRFVGRKITLPTVTCVELTFFKSSRTLRHGYSLTLSLNMKILLRARSASKGEESEDSNE